MRKKMSKKTAIILISIIAILLVVIFASVIIIYNREKENEKYKNIEQADYRGYDSKFEAYEGEKKGSNVKQLITTIISNNLSSIENNLVEQIVQFNGISNEEELVNIRTTIKSGYTYNISFEYDEIGLIKNIICEEVK